MLVYSKLAGQGVGPLVPGLFVLNLHFLPEYVLRRTKFRRLISTVVKTMGGSSRSRCLLQVASWQLENVELGGKAWSY